MSSEQAWETTDVLICGCGPTGAMLSGYLDSMAVRNIVLEREAEITTDPRGIVLDDDGIRYLQGLGLYEHVYTAIGSCIEKVLFLPGEQQSLHTKPSFCFKTASSEGYTGHVGVISHKQPVLEKHLRSVIEESQYSQLRSRCTLESIQEDKEWVYATYADSEGTNRQIRARFLVGADGKTGYVRKQYLEPRGITMDWAEQCRYEETWVALNWEIRLPTVETHPDFPLWRMGYSSEEVYDSFFPKNFRFLCNPRRPAVCGRFGQKKDRLWRFEFVVQPGEDPQEMSEPNKIREIVFPYLRHPGTRYGLDADVEFPTDCIKVLRSRPFRFAARKCNKWALGRVILCGDAAHVFPLVSSPLSPMCAPVLTRDSVVGGQGIASGFRDAIALAWRLAILTRSRSTQLDYEQVLEGWYSERSQQFQKSLNTTLRNGQLVNSTNPVQNFIRDWAVWVMQLIPPVKHQLELGPRREGPVRYIHSAGMPFLPSLNGGLCFPQTYCSEIGRLHSRIQFTDDVIFSKEKAKLFQIVILLDKPEQAVAATQELDGIDGLSGGHLSAKEATLLVHALKCLPDDEYSEFADLSLSLFRIATAEEFQQSDLCVGRPEPQGYNDRQIWQVLPGKRFVIVRHDRFVYAACATRAELVEAAKSLVECLPLD
ncbi:hypothetical protein Asppvi_009966 [Aspergillus pseudoviridinutans]|uniref:FAD-binding domain-containing protein n=1 Tax=Aspergillus pseudoviridinutans TaxID=1517512 RepID=A0A9P3EWM9_9EURO|nr:uncharacterized protein Asppvi_009966 [Aspergillus pseudoviridinutans]GIJ91001.1 hypothetical protein Asppvi_009966 [Aspergillus pseudoviridinutans]